MDGLSSNGKFDNLFNAILGDAIDVVVEELKQIPNLCQIHGIIYEDQIYNKIRDSRNNNLLLLSRSNEMRELLSQYNIDINHENNNNETLLMRIINMISHNCTTQNTDDINWIIKHGANVNYMNRLGKSLFHIGINHDKYLKLLISNGMNPESEAEISDCTSRVNLYIRENIDINIDKYLTFRLTLNIIINPMKLDLTISRIKQSKIYYLLSKLKYFPDADIDRAIYTYHDIQLLNLIFAKGYLAIINYWKTINFYDLIIWYRDEHNNTALHHAINNSGNPLLINLLIDDGLDLNFKNNYGISPMMLLSTHKGLFNRYNSHLLIHNRRYLVYSMKSNDAYYFYHCPMDLIRLILDYLD